MHTHRQTPKDGEGKGIPHVHDLERLRNSRGVGQLEIRGEKNGADTIYRE